VSVVGPGEVSLEEEGRELVPLRQRRIAGEDAVGPTKDSVRVWDHVRRRSGGKDSDNRVAW